MQETLKVERTHARLIPEEKEVIRHIMQIERLTESEAVRYIIRQFAKMHGLWPILTCPDCDSTTIDHVGGDNYRCECGHHFGSSKE
jgi:hypothetical protein